MATGHNLAGEIALIKSLAVREGFRFEYEPPPAPGFPSQWTVRPLDGGHPRASHESLTRAYGAWCRAMDAMRPGWR